MAVKVWGPVSEVIPASLPEVYTPLLEYCGYLIPTVGKTLTTHSVLLRVRMFRLGHKYTLGSNRGQETASNALTVRSTVLRLIWCHINHVVPGVLLCNWVSLRPFHQANIMTPTWYWQQAEDSGRLGFVAVSLDNWFTVVAVSHEEFFVDHRNLEEKSDNFLRNVRNHLPSDAASHPRRPESTPTLWKPQNLQAYSYFIAYHM
jgi:hypothetical protein